MQVVNTLLPVFAIIALGGALQKSGFLAEAVTAGLNKLTYWVALPSLLFYKIATSSYPDTTALRIFTVVALGMAGGILLALIIAPLVRVSLASLGTFVQASFRGNLAFIGLPVIIYAAGSGFNVVDSEIETLAVLVIAPMVPLYNLAGVILLLLSRKRLQLSSLRSSMISIVTNPLLIAGIMGMIFLAAEIGLPPAISRTCEALGRMSLPLALLSIGATLMTVPIRGSLAHASWATVVKIGLTPCIGWLIASYLHLQPAETKLALIYLACPTAASSHVLVDQIGGNRSLAASSIVLSTVLAAISLGIVVAAF